MTDQEPHSGANTAEADVMLLRRIQNRDEAALGQLYDEKSRLVYSLAYSVVNDHGDAEEITQEAFFRVWDRAAAFNPERGSVLAWLVTMTRRLAIDRTRSRQFKARGRESSIEAVGEGAGAAATGHNSIEVAVEVGEVFDALEQLDPRYRDVVQLSYYQGIPHSGIAERLGIPLGTVKSRLREGVGQLRQILGIGQS